jgi:nicotinamidase-related amidase
MNHSVASSDSQFLSLLRAEGLDTAYFHERIASMVISNINALARCVRANDGVVIWIRPEMRTDNCADWPVGSRRDLAANGFDTPSYEGLASFALLEGLEAEPGDHYFASFSPSVFWGSPLLSTLRNLGVTGVFITGCFTDSEVVISALDSTNTGFITTVVDDACASISEQRHLESIALHSRLFRVASTSEVIARIETES